MTSIVLDTETTGLDPEEGDRIVEIGMVEINDFGRTGRTYQQYVNPNRPISKEAREVHGLEDEFLADKPQFKEIADEFLDFIGESTLVVHNAPFDMGFVNQELKVAGKPDIKVDRVVDSLEMARKELPNLSRYSLDALCRYFKIDNRSRILHGALLDAELLTDVYFALLGANQDMFALVGMDLDQSAKPAGAEDWTPGPRPRQLKPRITEEELAAHRRFVEELGKEAIWNRFM